MSDDDRDIDIESDDDNDSDTGTSMPQRHSTQNFTQEEKRAHHNALERKRRDHIKESFTNLREAVPSLKGEKACRAQILKKTTDCIQNMRRKIQANQKDVNDLKHQIAILEEEVYLLESAKNGNEIDVSSYHQLINCDQSDGDEQDFSRRSKKMKTSYQTKVSDSNTSSSVLIFISTGFNNIHSVSFAFNDCVSPNYSNLNCPRKSTCSPFYCRNRGLNYTLMIHSDIERQENILDVVQREIYLIKEGSCCLETYPNTTSLYSFRINLPSLIRGLCDVFIALMNLWYSHLYIKVTIQNGIKVFENYLKQSPGRKAHFHLSFEILLILRTRDGQVLGRLFGRVSTKHYRYDVEGIFMIIPLAPPDAAVMTTYSELPLIRQVTCDNLKSPSAVFHSTELGLMK
uniref:Protein max n=1 Tax=Glossina palpalis gambiensis TaxID=67801 RepID=A0A1B0BP29_9MUSC